MCACVCVYAERGGRWVERGGCEDDGDDDEALEQVINRDKWRRGGGWLMRDRHVKIKRQGVNRRLQGGVVRVGVISIINIHRIVTMMGTAMMWSGSLRFGLVCAMTCWICWKRIITDILE